MTTLVISCISCSFILTMRNVNGEDFIDIKSNMKSFILTMRNVNEKIMKILYDKDKVLY